MPKKPPSAKSSKNTKARSGDRLSAAARRIVAGLGEGIAHNRGEIVLPTRYYIPADRRGRHPPKNRTVPGRFRQPLRLQPALVARLGAGPPPAGRRGAGLPAGH